MSAREPGSVQATENPEQSAPRDTSRKASPAVGGALAVAAIVLSAFSLRTAVTSVTPLLDELGQELGFGSTVASILGMAPTLMFAAGGPITPIIVRRFGLQHTAVIAMGLATLGLVGRVAGGTFTLLVLTSVALLGMGIGNVVIPPLVKFYFPDRIGAMSSLYITALQLGTAIPPLVAVPVAHAATWRTSLAMWAVMSLLAVLPWLRLVRGATGEPHSTGASAGTLAGKVRTSRLAWGLTGMFAMTSLNTYAMFTWLPKIITDAGHSASFGGVMLALFSGMGLVSALVAPAVAARLHNPFPLVLASVTSFAVGYVGLWTAPGALVPLWVLLIGLGPTTFPLALTLINLRSRTPAGSAALSGFAQGIGYLVACAGPLVVGTLRTSSGGWGVSFVFLGTTLALLLVGGFISCRPQFVEDTLRPHRSDATTRP